MERSFGSPPGEPLFWGEAKRTKVTGDPRPARSAAGEASGLTAGSGVCCILDQACVVESAKAFEVERNNLCDKSGRQHGFHI